MKCNKMQCGFDKPLLCEALSVKQKRQLAAENFEVHNYVYRNICYTEMMMNDFKDGSGYGIFSGSRNYDDVYVKFNELNKAQIALLNEWCLSHHLELPHEDFLLLKPNKSNEFKAQTENRANTKGHQN